MGLLMVASGFFSSSEAALFSLSRSQRQSMSQGTDSEKTAVALLQRPDRLLTAILFWNLVINMIYFALSSVLTLRLATAEPREDLPAWAPQAVAIGSLGAIIVMSELLPKNIGVLNARGLSAWIARPLGAAVRALDPLLPLLQGVSDAFARLLLPRLQTEPLLALSDLERAVQLGSGDTLDSEALLVQERQVLHRLVDLADTQVIDLMRPRRRCLVFRPPIALNDLIGQTDEAGEYLLVTEPGNDEIASAVPLKRLALLPDTHLERHADPVVFVPWCASAAVTLEQLREEDRTVAVVINELGETTGVVTIEQLLDAVLRDTTRPDPGDAYAARLHQTGPTTWEASGATPLRRVVKGLERWAKEAQAPRSLAKGLDEALGASLADTRSRTIGGLVQELLERAPRRGDRVDWAGMGISVTSGPTSDDELDDTPLVVRIELGNDPASAEDAEADE